MLGALGVVAGGGPAVLWLDLGMQNVAVASELLKPYDALQMPSHPVSTRINYVANDGQEGSAPVELAEVQDRLFS